MEKSKPTAVRVYGLVRVGAVCLLAGAWILITSGCGSSAKGLDGPIPMSREGVVLIPPVTVAPVTVAPVAVAKPPVREKKSSKYEGEEIEMDRVTLAEEAGREGSFDFFAAYKVVPGDVLDVLYHVSPQVDMQSGFKLAADQQVSVKFVNLPELNEAQIVRPDGRITLPYIGDVVVNGMTVEDLTKELKSRYSKTLKSPELYVTVPDFRANLREFKADLHTAPRGLSRLVTVRPDGFVTFAMLGDVFAAGKTIPEINTMINKRYQQVMSGLSADLFLETHAGSRVYVMGQVTTPGAYNILKPTTVQEALTMAGSPLYSAKLSDVVVVRKRGEKMVATKVDVYRPLAMKKNSQFFYLQPDDIVYVPKRTITRLSDFSKDIAGIVLFRGWGVSFDYSLNPDRTRTKGTQTINSDGTLNSTTFTY
ncbi:MAG: polysaccharide biosynthesis/export family protein [bacterium]